MILVTGGSGVLGKYLIKELESHNLNFEAPTRKYLDIASSSSIDNFLAGKNYNCIMHLAAETNVDLCEREPNKAYLINSIGTEKIAQYAKKINASMIFISTSAVFGMQSKLKYCELDVPLPLNLYGHSKFHAEQSVRYLCSNYLIIRSSWMIGGGPEKDNKFISKVLPDLLAIKPIYAVHDKWGSLTYAKTLAAFIVYAHLKNLNGVRHFASTDYCSRAEITEFIANHINVKSTITRVDSSMFPLSAPRAFSEVLYSLHTEAMEKFSWKEIIKDYLNEWL